jgi:hypothetical protein
MAFSILAQSPMDQPMVLANRDDWLDSATPDVFDAIKHQKGGERARRIEGAFIEASVKVLGQRPPWNHRDANSEGRDFARPDHYELVRYLSGVPSTLTSKYTIRELSNDPAACGLEEALHGARIFCLGEAVHQGKSEIKQEELFAFLKLHDQGRAQLYVELGYEMRAYPLFEPRPKE